MEFFSSRHFHRLTKEHLPLPDEWPADWTTTFYKEYPRFKTIPLPDVPLSADLLTVIKTRVSRRAYQGGNLTLEDLGSLLKYACGNTQPMPDDDPQVSGRYHRATPSAGARFPIEAYIFVFRQSDALQAGIYHYRVRENALEVLYLRSFSPEDIQTLFHYEWVRSASVAIVLTGVFRRTEDKYGRTGYRYVLLEAGHIVQNTLLIATALQLPACPLVGVNDEAIESLLEIDGISESFVYAVVLGR